MIFNVFQKKIRTKKIIFYLIVIQGIINKIKKNNKRIKVGTEIAIY